MKRPQKQQKPNFEHNFLAKEQERRGNNSTNLSLLLSGFPKKNVGKVVDFGLQFSFKDSLLSVWCAFCKCHKLSFYHCCVLRGKPVLRALSQ